MIKPIVKDIFLLKQKSSDADVHDAYIAKDLSDTLNHHRNECAGMAANMIGYTKRIIIVSAGIGNLVMFNPVILQKSGAYETEEGCLSLSGARKTVRYRNITVKYQDSLMKVHTAKYSGWIAQIIQHECDHLEGILI